MCKTGIKAGSQQVDKKSVFPTLSIINNMHFLPLPSYTHQHFKNSSKYLYRVSFKKFSPYPQG